MHMAKQNFNVALISGLLSASMCVGLVATAFFVQDEMVDDAISQVAQTQQQALDAYETALMKYSNHDVVEPDDDRVQLQVPSVTEPVATEPISDNTVDGEPSGGEKDNDGDDATTNDSDDTVVVPDKDPKPESTGWDEGDTFVEHMVAYGDTLSAIAERYSVTMAEIAEFNGIQDANVIEVGQILIIPMTNDWHLT